MFKTKPYFSYENIVGKHLMKKETRHIDNKIMNKWKTERRKGDTTLDTDTFNI